MVDLSDTILSKSDQLNADDLLVSPITIRITSVNKTETGEQRVSINYEGDNGKPFKPCKSMIRVLVSIWGQNGNDYVGKSLTLFRDPSVKFGGQAVGGVRISHASDIEKDTSILLPVTRAKRAPYQIKKLVTQSATYPDDKFEAEKEKIEKSISTGKATPEKIIAYMSRAAVLTQQQIDYINSIQQPQAQEPETQDEEY